MSKTNVIDLPQVRSTSVEPQVRSTSDEVETAQDLLTTSVMDTAESYEKLTPSVYDNRAAHDLLTDTLEDTAGVFEEINKQQQFFNFADFGGVSERLVVGFDEVDKQLDQMISDLESELSTNESIAAARKRFEKEANRLYPDHTSLLTKLNKSLNEQITIGETTKKGLKAFGGVIQGVGKSFESQFSDYLNQPTLKAISSGASAVSGAVKDSYNERQASKRESFTRDRMGEVKARDTATMGKIKDLQKQRSEKPTSGSVHLADRFKPQKDVDPLLVSIDKTTKDILFHLKLKSLIGLVGGGMGGRMRSIGGGTKQTNTKQTNTKQTNSKQTNTKSTPKTGTVSPVGKTELPTQQKAETKPETKPKTTATKPDSKPVVKSAGAEKSKKGFFDLVSKGVKKAVSKGGLGVIARVAGIAASATPIGAAIAGVIGAGLTIHEIASTFGVYDIVEKEIEQLLGGGESKPEIEPTTGTASTPLTVADAQPQSSVPTYTKAEQAEAKASKAQREQQIADNATATATATGGGEGATMVSSSSSNVNNNTYMGSSFGFDNSNYQSGYDKGTSITR